MDFRKVLLLIPVAFVVFTSGCTSPVCIPFLPFIPCDRVVEFEDDVIIIKSLEALPQTVSPSQQIRLVAYIQNVGKEPVPQDKLSENLKKQKITVDLYDFCEGLFSKVGINCEGSYNDDEHKCKITNLLPGQIKEIDWTLTAGSKEQVPLKSECDLKVYVTYPYKTTSLTTITFIDYQEMQRQLSEGTFRRRDSYIVSGYGPVKPWITVEDQQPIPVQQNQPGRTVVALRIKNSGKGYLCRLDADKVVCDSKIPKGYVEIEGIAPNKGLGYPSDPESICAFPNSVLKEDVTLVKKESPPLLCEIELKSDVNLPKETTQHVTTEIEYLYEFRKELKVVIEPKI